MVLRRLPPVFLLALAACRTTPAPTTASAAADTVAVVNGLAFPHGPHRYVCDGGRAFDALFPVPDSVRLRFDTGRTFALGSARSASGARYSDGATTAWFRGMTEGFVQEGDAVTYADCHRTDE